MPQWMSKKLKPYNASIFDTIGALARERDAVNLSQGFPDFDGPEIVKEAACRAIRNGFNQYAPPYGVPQLNQALHEKYLQTTGLDFDPVREITILAGATEAMYATLTAICEPGDAFIVFEPIYDTYMPIIQMCGGRVIPVALHPPGFRFDPNELKAAFAEGVRGIILNSPHNPTGTVFNRQEMELIRDLCVTHDCIAITDEVYEHLVFDENRHISLAGLEGMRERTLTISSTAKSFSLTGWKIGYVLAPPEATLAIRRLHQFVIFAVATPFQHAMAVAIRNRDHLLPALCDDLLRKRNDLCAGLDKLGYRTRIPEGTFFAMADFSQVSDQPDTEFSVDLIKSEAAVAVIPNSVFYVDQDRAPKNFIRFCFAKQDETLAQGLRQLSNYRR